jgi:hypothetical protein
MRIHSPFVTRNTGHLRISRHYLNYAEFEGIKERVSQWSSIARSHPLFRIPELYIEPAGELCLYMPPVPEGFQFASRINPSLLPTRVKLQIILCWLDGLQHLHNSNFHMGFLAPEHILIHPDGGLLCDIQPFPGIMPFLQAATNDYPPGLFPTAARTFRFPRYSDYAAVSGLIHWLFGGVWTLQTPESMTRYSSDGLPAGLIELSRTLSDQTDHISSAADIADRLCKLFPAELVSGCRIAAPARLERYQPASQHGTDDLPILPEEADRLNEFVRTDGPMSLAVTGLDRSERFHIVRTLINRSLEHNMYLTFQSSNLPFGTVRTIMDRLITIAVEYHPPLRDALFMHRRSLDQAFSKHNQGTDIQPAIILWLTELFNLLQPIYSSYRLYFVFENCEAMDEDSSQLLQAVWNRILEDKLPIRFLYTGTMLPEGIHAPCFTVDLNLYGTARASIAGSNIGFCVTGLSPMKTLKEICLELNESLTEFLAVLTCLPSPVRAYELWQSRLGPGVLEQWLSMLQESRLIRVYHTDSVYVPDEAAAALQSGWSEADFRAYNKKALDLIRAFRPKQFGSLITLAERAQDTRSLYLLNVLYYRMNRKIMKMHHKKDILEKLSSLNQGLNRIYLPCWDRLLFDIYLNNMNEFMLAGLKADRLYQATGSYQDLVLKQRVLFMQGTPVQKDELLEWVAANDVPLKAKVSAAEILLLQDFTADPIGLEAAQRIGSFYHEELYPKRGEISIRLFAQISIVYLLMVSKYLPEREAWGLHFRQKLEMILENSSHQI